jgi:uncharacterized protein (TIGR03083 family)
MTSLDYLGHLRADSTRFLDVLGDADPTRRVPSCPDWDAADLLWHLGEVQWFWGSIVEGRLQSPEGLEPPPRPAGHDALAAFFAEQSARLHDVLAAAEPEEPVYMWAADKTVGYIRRRQAHEALIHRLDAELVTGEVTPLDRHLAADGVLEALDIMRGGCPPWGSFTPSQDHVAVRITDTGGEVPVVLGRFSGTDPDSGTSYDEDDLSVASADPAATPRLVVSGTADDLDAWLWARRDASAISFEGDQGVAERLQAVLRQPID